MLGGALGAAAGFIAMWFNTRLFRTELSPPLKYAATLVVSLLAVVIYFVTAMLIYNSVAR